MIPTSNDPTPRRDFLGQIAASAIVLAGTACAAPAVATQPTPAAASPNDRAAPPAPAPAAPVHWDDTWFGKLTAKHKAVFDSPAIDDGLAVSQAAGYIRGMRDAAGAGVDDVQAVVVIRHEAIPLAFNDAMWEKYKIGEMMKMKARGGAWETRNPVLRGTGDVVTVVRPQGNLAWLAAHNNVLLGCDLATRGFAGEIAQKTKGDSKAIYEELKTNLVPGLILQPTGVYAVHRAQEAGCTYIRST